MIITRGVAALIALVLIAGCGSDDGGASTGATGATGPPGGIVATGSHGQPTVPPGSGLATTPAAISTAPATPPATTAAVAVEFSSPSGNIGCYLDSVGARCDIESSDFVVPKKPASCLLAWGHGVAVDRISRANFVCAGDTTLGAAKILAYGLSANVGSFQCTSEETGMTCVNLDTTHGFRLSKEVADVF